MIVLVSTVLHVCSNCVPVPVAERIAIASGLQRQAARAKLEPNPRLTTVRLCARQPSPDVITAPGLMAFPALPSKGGGVGAGKYGPTEHAAGASNCKWYESTD